MRFGWLFFDHMHGGSQNQMVSTRAAIQNSYFPEVEKSSLSRLHVITR